MRGAAHRRDEKRRGDDITETEQPMAKAKPAKTARHRARGGFDSPAGNVVAGGTGSGKTTFLNVLSSFLPPSERIVTIEDAAELSLAQEHVVRLESRPANIQGAGEIRIRDLLRNSLRMRPDRIIVGECRSG